MGTGGHSYWWWDDWGLGWGGGVDGAASASTRSLDLVVFGVAAIGVIKCYYDAYRFVREFVRQRLGRISNEVLGLPENATTEADASPPAPSSPATSALRGLVRRMTGSR